MYYEEQSIITDPYYCATCTILLVDILLLLWDILILHETWTFSYQHPLLFRRSNEKARMESTCSTVVASRLFDSSLIQINKFEMINLKSCPC